MSNRASRRERGISITELLTSVTLIGVIAILIAPVEIEMVRRLGRVDHETLAAMNLPRAAQTLGADARNASRVHIESNRVTFEFEDREEIVWEETAQGLLRFGRSPRSGRAHSILYAGVARMEASAGRGALLQVTLASAKGRVRSVSVQMRNQGRGR